MPGSVTAKRFKFTFGERPVGPEALVCLVDPRVAKLVGREAVAHEQVVEGEPRRPVVRHIPRL